MTISAAEFFLSNLPKESNERKMLVFQDFFDALAGRRRRLERCQHALQQAAACAASPRSDRVDQVALVLDRPFEQRRYASDRTGGVRVRAGDLRHPEMTRYLQREDVLVFAACAVEHFDRVDELENF